MSDLGTPPSILMNSDYSLDKAIEKASIQELQQICVAMMVKREGNISTLIKNLKPKMRDIQEWTERYRSIGGLDWTMTLERTFNGKIREKSD